MININFLLVSVNLYSANSVCYLTPLYGNKVIPGLHLKMKVQWF